MIVCDEKYWSDDATPAMVSEESSTSEGSENAARTVSEWEYNDLYDSPAGLSSAVSISSADETTELIRHEDEIDSLSDTSLGRLEAAATEYLLSGGNSYSRAEDSK